MDIGQKIGLSRCARPRFFGVKQRLFRPKLHDVVCGLTPTAAKVFIGK